MSVCIVMLDPEDLYIPGQERGDRGQRDPSPGLFRISTWFFDDKKMTGKKGNLFSFEWHGWIGLGIIGVSEISLFAGVSFVSTFFTPLVWTGYLLFVDSLVHKKKGASLILNRPKEFALMLPLSIGFWLIFEFYNLYLKNWHYVGLPEGIFLRYVGYAWAFATIWPAILITAEALESWNFLSPRRMKAFTIQRKHIFILVTLGTICLISPFLFSSEIARYLAAPVWLGFIFLLDPCNYLLRGKSLLGELGKGSPRLLCALLLSGMICGLFWEFWNFWAGAKWHYTVPILGDIKIFEMPILGYLGFPPFAVECFVMYEFVKNLCAGKRKCD